MARPDERSLDLLIHASSDHRPLRLRTVGWQEYTREVVVLAAVQQVGTGADSKAGGPGTEESNPDFNGSHLASSRQQSLRSNSVRPASLRKGTMRDGVVGGEGVLLRPGDGAFIGVEAFEGGLVQGKKAPGGKVSRTAATGDPAR